LIRSEQGLLNDLQDAERKRLTCLEAYAGQTGGDPAGVTLAQMVESAPEDMRGSLAGIHGSMRATLESLMAINEENRLLVESQLMYTRYMLSALTEEGATHTYSSQGGEKGKPAEPPQRTMDFSV